MSVPGVAQRDQVMQPGIVVGLMLSETNFDQWGIEEKREPANWFSSHPPSGGLLWSLIIRIACLKMSSMTEQWATCLLVKLWLAQKLFSFLPSLTSFSITLCCPEIRCPLSFALDSGFWETKVKIYILVFPLLTYLRCLLYCKSSFPKCVCFKSVYFVPLIHFCSFANTTHSLLL